MSDVNIKIKQLDEIEGGLGVQHILDEVHGIMGNPALMFDMGYSLIASPTAVVNDDPIWCEFMTYGKLKNETIEFFKNESFIDIVANCTQFDGVSYLFSSKLKYDRIFGQLYNRDNLPVADLVMVACENPFDDYTPELIKKVCNIISKEISQNEYYNLYGQKYQDGIIKELVDGNIKDKGVYSGHVSNIDKGLKANIFIAVVDVMQPEPEKKTPAYYRDLFQQAEPEFKYSIYLNYILILISSDRPELQIDQNFKNLTALFEQENVRVGISSAFENLFELRTYYFEALLALFDGEKMADIPRINLYNKRPGMFPAYKNAK